MTFGIKNRLYGNAELLMFSIVMMLNGCRCKVWKVKTRNVRVELVNVAFIEKVFYSIIQVSLIDVCTGCPSLAPRFSTGMWNCGIVFV